MKERKENEDENNINNFFDKENNDKIVTEGIDGSGKETQTNLLFKYLQSQNKKVIKQSFPNYKSQSSIESIL